MIYYNIVLYVLFLPAFPCKKINLSDGWGLHPGSLAIMIYDYLLETFEFSFNYIHNLANLIQNLIGRFYGNLIPLILAAHAF